MLSQKIIESEQTKWAAQIVFALKKDGAIDFCVDYCQLHAATKRGLYPIHEMNESIDSLGKAKIFSTLVAKRGYWQIEIEEADRGKPVFSSHYGLYRSICMPFGLRKAPGTFQSTMDVILSIVR